MQQTAPPYFSLLAAWMAATLRRLHKCFMQQTAPPYLSLLATWNGSNTQMIESKSFMQQTAPPYFSLLAIWNGSNTQTVALKMFYATNTTTLLLACNMKRQQHSDGCVKMFYATNSRNYRYGVRFISHDRHLFVICAKITCVDWHYHNNHD